MRAVLDTSVFIGQEQGRVFQELPEQVAVSTITLAELELGVLLAPDVKRRQQRLKTLLRAKEFIEPLPITETVASSFAALVADLRSLKQKMNVQDAWIAATAISHGAAVCTQDHDFDVVPNLTVIHLDHKMNQ